MAAFIPRAGAVGFCPANCSCLSGLWPTSVNEPGVAAASRCRNVLTPPAVAPDLLGGLAFVHVVQRMPLRGGYRHGERDRGYPHDPARA